MAGRVNDTPSSVLNRRERNAIPIYMKTPQTSAGGRGQQVTSGPSQSRETESKTRNLVGRIKSYFGGFLNKGKINDSDYIKEASSDNLPTSDPALD
jgi:hypothetical protein